MFVNLKYNLTHNWSALRVVRMLLAIIAIWQWIVVGDVIMGLVGIFIGYQAIANISCAGGNCYMPNSGSKNTSALEAVQFEEIK